MRAVVRVAQVALRTRLHGTGNRTVAEPMPAGG
jgi:hypothetical protein